MAIDSDELPVAGTSLAVADNTSQISDVGKHLFEQNSLLGELVAERYRVIELLGTGGMGCVYLAEHVHMRKPVAFKVLHKELTHLPDIVARFEREAIAAARIAHPNVATATDFGRLSDGACYLVLEYVQGKSLRQGLLQSAPFPIGRSLNIAKQIALALGAAHEAGIVHRDLKPENVMLVDGASGPDFVKVLDFGIAKIHMPEQEAQTALTRMGTIFGTPEYMSPEQALGQNADSRTDLYSLGIILYEMLTGRTPFADKELVAVLTRQMTELPPPLPSNINPNVVAIVSTLLAKRPSERPQTANEVVTRIESILALFETDTGELAVSGARLTPFAPTLNDGSLAEATNEQSSADSQPRQLPKASIPPWLRRSVRIGQHRFPAVMVLLFSFGAAFVVLLVVTILSLSRAASPMGHSSAANGSAGPAASPSPLIRLVAPDPLLKRARLGDSAALHELETRSPGTLDAEHWAAMARGRARNRDWKGMLEAYENALNKEPQLSTDGELIGDTRAAALDPITSTTALQFAAERLEQKGADIVYDAWASAASGRGAQVDTKTAKKLLESSAVRRHASKSLLVALEMLDARGCTEYKRTLPKVISDGDERCLKTLRRLSHDRGCGIFGLGDCYGCLRGNGILSQALEAAKGRPGPSF